MCNIQPTFTYIYVITDTSSTEYSGQSTRGLYYGCTPYNCKIYIVLKLKIRRNKQSKEKKKSSELREYHPHSGSLGFGRMVAQAIRCLDGEILLPSVGAAGLIYLTFG